MCTLLVLEECVTSQCCILLPTFSETMQHAGGGTAAVGPALNQDWASVVVQIRVYPKGIAAIGPIRVRESSRPGR